MKKIFYVFFVGLLCVNPLAVVAAAKTAVVKPQPWKALTPSGYAPITWAQAPGVATFYKAPTGNGTMDFLTRIYLPQNTIGPVISGEPIDNGSADSNFIPDRQAQVPDPSEVNEIIKNFAYTRVPAEAIKKISSEVKFVWDAPFFNMGKDVSDLSLAMKYVANGKTLVTSGTRSDADLVHERRMLLVDNKTGKAAVAPFDSIGFLDKAYDFALEGFAPTTPKTSDGDATGRLFLGVLSDGKELIVYCSRQATAKEASRALVDAGVAPANQLQVDGGGSTACGYNLPGQFFVEPSRTLPLVMGASTLVARGTITTQDTNARSGPSTKDKIITKLNKGAAVLVREEKNGWYRIGDGMWVKKTLVKNIDIGK